MPGHRFALAAAIVVSLLAPASAASATSLTVQTSPAPMYPAFDPAIKDYVVRCAGSPTTTFAVTAPRGTAVQIRPGSLSGQSPYKVPLGPGSRKVIRVASNGGVQAYSVRCLPADFPQWTVTATSPDAEAQYVLVAPSISFTLGLANYMAMFDRHGVPVWWMRTTFPPMDAQVTRSGTVLFGQHHGGTFNSDPGSVTEERRLDGRLVGTVRAVGGATDFHDAEDLPNGNHLVLSYRPRPHVDLREWGGGDDETVEDAVVQELNPAGAVVWSWNSAGHIGVDEMGRWFALSSTPLEDGQTVRDVVHANSMQLSGDTLVLSARHVDAVYGISRTTGDILWKLGGSHVPQSLTVVNDPAGDFPLGGQHDARILPDGTLTVHDNATGLAHPSRAVRYRLDLQARTATLVESIQDPDVPGSGCCGSARRMKGGQWLVSWGGEPEVREYQPDGQVVFGLDFGDFFSYRAFPVPDGTLDSATLQAAMDAQDRRTARCGRMAAWASPSGPPERQRSHDPCG